MNRSTLETIVAFNLALVEQPLGFDEDVVEKGAKGWQKPGAKYLRREPDGKGGYRYFYAEDSNPRQRDLFATEAEEQKTPQPRNAREARQLALFDQPVQEIVEAPPPQTFRQTVEYDPAKPWSHPDWTPDLASYDTILVNSSGGKDSQAMMDRVVRLCDEQGIPRDRVLVVHADLGKVEWPGTRELAEKQAKHYGLRFEVVTREKGDLLEQVRDRYDRMQQREKDAELLAKEHGIDTFGALASLDTDDLAAMLPEPDTHRSFPPRQRAVQLLKSARQKDPNAPIDFGSQVAWPSSQARYCTSDQKTSQVNKLIKRLGAERVLNCLGIRAQESPARAKKPGFALNRAASSKSRQVDNWYPIFGWPEEQVWHTIDESGVPHHYAYDRGMSRLSCAFCVFASKRDLAIAAESNPELFKEYLRLEQEVGATFQPNSSLAEAVESIKGRRRETFGNKVPLSALSLSKAGDIEVGPLLEALHVSLALYGGSEISVDWKDEGACLHVTTADGQDSAHVAYMQGAHARAGALFAAAVAEAHGLAFSEHGTPPPVNV